MIPSFQLQIKLNTMSMKWTAALMVEILRSEKIGRPALLLYMYMPPASYQGCSIHGPVENQI